LEEDMNFYHGIDYCIGKTPLVLLHDSFNNSGNNIFLKLDFFNPVGSVKDRAAKFILSGAEYEGLLGDGSRIVEPTSGNTGIALAALCAARNYDITLVMPSSVSEERKKLLTFFGADIILTDLKGGMGAAISKAEEIIQSGGADFMPNQFVNPYNVKAHFETTGPEIYEDLEGCVDCFVAGVGTGGTITGTGQYLKSKDKNVKIIAVEPFESPVISGGDAAPHLIQGIGAGFIPENLDIGILDEVVKVKGEDALLYSRMLAKKSGILCGISSGAAVFASLQISARYADQGLNIVTILPSTGERYLSTQLFRDI